MRKLLILSILLPFITSCSNQTANSLQNMKLINGLSYPVDGGQLLNKPNTTVSFVNSPTNNVYNICNGEVVERGTQANLKTYVLIKCSKDFEIIYANLANINVSTGNSIAAGTIFATSKHNEPLDIYIFQDHSFKKLMGIQDFLEHFNMEFNKGFLEEDNNNQIK